MGSDLVDVARIGSVSAAFLVVGIGVGLVGVTIAGWAETAFGTNAAGDAGQFGPIFVAQLYLAITAAALIGAPVLAGAIGMVVGMRTFAPVSAALTCGIGAGLGALVYGVIVVGLLVGTQGPAAGQAYGLIEATGPVLVAAVISGVVSAATGVFGTWLH